MSSYGRNFSSRLFVQAAFTGFLAPLSSHGSTWLVATFAVAAAAAAVGAIIRTGHERTRELVIGFEVAAVAVGAVGLIGHHYIPGTIVGIAALVTALNHPMPRDVAVPVQGGPVGAVGATAYAPPPPPYAAPMAAPVAAPVQDYAAPLAEPVAPVQPVAPAPAPVTGVRAMNILPGR
jgi:hypothetical protein